MDAFTDGVFSIVATLLVLEVKVPELPEHYSRDMLVNSLLHVLPSFIAFAFSFLTVIIYWINHDNLSALIRHYTPRVKYLNLLLLFWICLIPFPTKFISEYPLDQIAVISYGLAMFLVATTANFFFWYLAYRTKLLLSSISLKTRKNYLQKTIGGPVLYAVSILVSFIHIYISIALFIIIPLLYVVLPKADLLEEGNG